MDGTLLYASALIVARGVLGSVLLFAVVFEWRYIGQLIPPDWISSQVVLQPFAHIQLHVAGLFFVLLVTPGQKQDKGFDCASRGTLQGGASARRASFRLFHPSQAVFYP